MQAKLIEIIEKRKDKILEHWFKKVIETYPFDKTQFFVKQKDPFANPVGTTTRRSLEGILDALLGGHGLDKIREHLDPIIRIRSVQTFTPSKATGFVISLKSVIKEQLKKDFPAESIHRELAEVYDDIDVIALATFDMYMECREKVFQIRTHEERNRIYTAFKKAGLVSEID